MVETPIRRQLEPVSGSAVMCAPSKRDIGSINFGVANRGREIGTIQCLGFHGLTIRCDNHAFVPPEAHIVCTCLNIQRGDIKIHKARILGVVLDPEVIGFCCCLDARYIDFKTVLIRQLVQKSVKIAAGKADFGHLFASERVRAHALDGGV